eukprot:RCo033129
MASFGSFGSPGWSSQPPGNDIATLLGGPPVKRFPGCFSSLDSPPVALGRLFPSSSRSSVGVPRDSLPSLKSSPGVNLSAASSASPRLEELLAPSGTSTVSRHRCRRPRPPAPPPPPYPCALKRQEQPGKVCSSSSGMPPSKQLSGLLCQQPCTQPGCPPPLNVTSSWELVPPPKYSGDPCVAASGAGACTGLSSSVSPNGAVVSLPSRRKEQPGGHGSCTSAEDPDASARRRRMTRPPPPPPPRKPSAPIPGGNEARSCRCSDPIPPPRRDSFQPVLPTVSHPSVMQGPSGSVAKVGPATARLRAGRVGTPKRAKDALGSEARPAPCKRRRLLPTSPSPIALLSP